MISSPCSAIDPLECIESAIARGLDGICVTEHDTLEGGLAIRDMAEGYDGFKVFVGMEVMSREGHLLIYGYDKDIKGVKPALEILEMVESAGGLVVPAHPWRQPYGWYSGTLDQPLDRTSFKNLFKVIEKYNGQSSPEQNRQGDNFCMSTGIIGTGGSDAHSLRELGCCTTVFDDRISSDAELVKALISGRCTARINDSYHGIWGG